MHASSSALGRRAHDISQQRLESPSLRAALKELDSLLFENTTVSTNNNKIVLKWDNTANVRRALRREIESRQADEIDAFAAAIAPVEQCIESAGKSVLELSEQCHAVLDTVDKYIPDGFLGEAAALAAELTDAELQLEFAERCAEVFSLTPEEQKALHGNAKGSSSVNDNTSLVETGAVNALKGNSESSAVSSVGEEFFAALARVAQIREDCKMLLRSPFQRAGLQIMDHMSREADEAYRRLYRWVKEEFRRYFPMVTSANQEHYAFADPDPPPLTPLLRQAVAVLRERPYLLMSCIDDVATARGHALLRAFNTALSIGGPGGMPRPIELHAHDPLRYVGDMLAWVHQTAASERELFSMLLQQDSDSPVLAPASPFTATTAASDAPSSALSAAASSDSTAAAASTLDVLRPLDRALEYVCRPLQTRITQVLSSARAALHSDDDSANGGQVFAFALSRTGDSNSGSKLSPVAALKLSNLLDFYAHTIDSAMREDKHRRGFSPALVSSQNKADKARAGAEAEAGSATGKIEEAAFDALSPDQVRPLQMTTVLQQSFTQALDVFFEIVKQGQDALIAEPPKPLLESLAPPPAIVREIALLGEVVSACEHSMLLWTGQSSPLNADRSNQAALRTISAVVDPLLTIIQLSAASYQGAASRSTPVSTSDAAYTAVYMINCLSRVALALRRSKLPAAADRIVIADEHVNANMDTLIDEQVAALLRYAANLIVPVEAAQTWLKRQEPSDTAQHQVSEPLSRMVGLSPTALQASITEFTRQFVLPPVDESLRGYGKQNPAFTSGTVASAESPSSGNTLLMLLPPCDRLEDDLLRERARARIAEGLIAAYRVVYEAAHHPAAGYVEPEKLFPYTPAQVAAIILPR